MSKFTINDIVATTNRGLVKMCKDFSIDNKFRISYFHYNEDDLLFTIESIDKSKSGVTISDNVCEYEIEFIKDNNNQKLPLGLKDKKIWKEEKCQERITAIAEAICRYIGTEYIIPREWVQELDDLLLEMEGYSNE